MTKKIIVVMGSILREASQRSDTYFDYTKCWIRFEGTTPRLGFKGIDQTNREYLRKNETDAINVLITARRFAATLDKMSQVQYEQWYSDVESRDDDWDYLVLSDYLINNAVAKEHIEKLSPLSMCKRFLNRLCTPEVDNHYIQKPDGGYTYIPVRLTPEMIQEHISGYKTRGVPFVDRSGYAMFLAFDEDRYVTFEERCYLDIIEERLRELGFMCLREGCRLVGSNQVKPGHLLVFFRKKVAARVLRIWAFDLLQELGLLQGTRKSVSSIDDVKPVKDLEVFPKQDQAKGSSNCLRIPFGCHRKANGERNGFQNCVESPDEQFVEGLVLIEKSLNDPELVVKSVGEKILQELTAHPELLKDEPQTNWTAYYRDLVSPYKRYGARENFRTLIDILKAIHWKWTNKSDRYLAQCPLCADEGGDHSCDNLQIMKETSTTYANTYGCWKGGVFGKEHTAKAIRQRFLELEKKFFP